MFRRITQSDPVRARALFRVHPADLAAMLDLAWEFRVNNTALQLGHPDRRSELTALPLAYLNLFGGASTTTSTAVALRGSVRWDHLIYAYMIESTRIYEIFRRVLQEYLTGEQLGVPDATSDVQRWLRNTEELFYRDPAPFTITSVTSHVRPDLIATRRNAYYRMFGMDLIHGRGDTPSYPYEKAKAANAEFVAVFEELLREIWVAISNFGNSSGEDPTDDGAIADLATKLHDMLRSRRLGGNLAREEFLFVSMMSWFHLTVEFDSPVVANLRAEALSPDQRLLKIGERVGLPAPTRTKSFFDLADPMSELLTTIETGAFNTAAAVPALYTPGPLQDQILIILTNWSLATGHDLKTRRMIAVGARV